MSEPVPTLLILGASGDLTERLLLPGLGSLLAVETRRRVDVIGVDRDPMAREDWQALVRRAFEGEDVPAETVDAVAGAAAYRQADLLDPAQLDTVLEGLSGPLVIYFALPPQITVQVCALLEKRTLPEGTRLALEKPIGHDLASARALNAQLVRVVPEEQVYRVDHFLGVNTVLNLIGVRFANRLLQPIWSAEHIERVDIVYDEDLALEGRAGYYDKAGALVDMIQSHLLQILALFAMESPARLSAEEVHPLKAQALRATRLWGGSPEEASRRARYTAGRIGEREVPDYVAEEGVDPGNDTETLAELVLEVHNARWSGVPFVLRSGKALGRRCKTVLITFRPPPMVPEGMSDAPGPDQLELELRPGAVTLGLSMNAEGEPFQLEQKHLHAQLGRPRMQPYGEILAGILDGDPLLAVRGEVAEQSWRIVEPVLAAWRAGSVPMQEYAAGSAGPDSWGEVPGWR